MHLKGIHKWKRLGKSKSIRTCKPQHGHHGNHWFGLGEANVDSIALIKLKSNRLVLNCAMLLLEIYVRLTIFKQLSAIFWLYSLKQIT